MNRHIVIGLNIEILNMYVCMYIYNMFWYVPIDSHMRQIYARNPITRIMSIHRTVTDIISSSIYGTIYVS